MARHRMVRNMSYEDDLSEDVYGRSLDELDYAISPATEAQFMYSMQSRHDPTLSAFMEEQPINEEDEYLEEQESESYQDYVKPKLRPHEEEKLHSGLEYIRDVMGESCDDGAATKYLIEHNFNVEKALDTMLNEGGKQSWSNTSTLGRTGLSITGYESSYTTARPKPKSENKYDANLKTVTSKAENLNLEGKDRNHIKDEASRVSFAEQKTNEVPVSSSSGVKSKSNDQTSIRLTAAATSSSTALASSSTTTTTTVTPSSSSSTLSTVTKLKPAFNVELEFKKRQEGKELLNLVVVGHVDAGKSTLMGHLLFRLGKVSKKAMHKNETESKKLGKGSFAFAWVLDETDEERSRGITMDVAMTTFETKSKTITLMDAPGHRDFIPNMIQGTAQADVAILVVDSARGAFEAGFESGGQTREHALLARSLGVNQLAVAINKLDMVDWSQERFNEIVNKLRLFLKQAGFKESDVTYIPCSGLTGENLADGAKESKLTSWYKGCSLADQIDNFKPPERPVNKPFRMCVSDVYKGQGSAFVVAGKMESGYVTNTSKILLMPAGENGTVKSLLINDEPVKFAVAGDHVTMGVTGVDMAHVNVGSVLCDPLNPIKASQRLVARIVVFNTDMPIVKGFMVILHCQNLSEPATISRLVSILSKSTGEVVQKRPRCLPKHSNAVVEVKTSRVICAELYRDNRVLGRFMLRSGGKTIAAGVITEIK